MSTSEKKYVAEAWAKCTADDQNFTLMTLVGGTSLTDCKELAIHAKEV